MVSSARFEDEGANRPACISTHPRSGSLASDLRGWQSSQTHQVGPSGFRNSAPPCPLGMPRQSLCRMRQVLPQTAHVRPCSHCIGPGSKQVRAHLGLHAVVALRSDPRPASQHHEACPRDAVAWIKGVKRGVAILHQPDAPGLSSGARTATRSLAQRIRCLAPKSHFFPHRSGSPGPGAGTASQGGAAGTSQALRVRACLGLSGVLLRSKADERMRRAKVCPAP